MLDTLVQHCDELLNDTDLEDYCPNGLQVDGGRERVKLIISGVTASQALVDAAVAAGADLLLVHHGYFWRGETAPLTGIKGRRIRTLMQQGISLLAYHLPLDVHPVLGNNRQLGIRLGFSGAAPLDAKGLLWGTTLDREMSTAELSVHLESTLGRTPLHLPVGNRPLQRIGWCTGAAQGYIDQAAVLGCDAFISGEVSEQTLHLAQELGIHYFAAGHHATERFGVQALGEHLMKKYQISHRFIDLDNPA